MEDSSRMFGVMALRIIDLSEDLTIVDVYNI